MGLCDFRDGLEDPLDDLGMVQQQLDQISTIARCEYKKTCRLLVSLFDETAQAYQQALNVNNRLECAIKEGQSGTMPWRAVARRLSAVMSRRPLFKSRVSGVGVGGLRFAAGQRGGETEDGHCSML